MGNSKLDSAKKAAYDEFYTQYADIQSEVNAYLDYNSNVFRDKVVLLPCDDPEWSNFTKFFAQNFVAFGIKKLISTSYARNSKKYNTPRQLSLFETEDEKYDPVKSDTHGKIFTLNRDANDSGHIDIDDLEWDYLEGDGDFASEEVKKLRDEADIIVTNPPFSLFREFIAWLFEIDKKFIIIGNINCVTYKEVFPLIKDNKMWVGYNQGGSRRGNSLLFTFPEGVQTNGVIEIDGTRFTQVSSWWFTNIDHGRRHQPLSLMTLDDNLRFSKHKDVKGIGYLKYDNFDGIEIPHTDAIPSDYCGAMGVPVSFLLKYNPDQFEILGISKTWDNFASKTYPKQIQIDKHGKESIVGKLNDGPVIKLPGPLLGETYYKVDEDFYAQLYARIFVKFRQGGKL